MKDQSEQQLLSLISQSNKLAFDEFLVRQWKPLYTHALKKTGSQEDAFDLVQDLFIGFWESRTDLPNISGEIKYYLRGILLHKIARYFRKKGFQKKHEESFLRFVSQDEHLEPDQYIYSNQTVDFEKVMDQVYVCIEDMPKRMRDIFRMNKLQNQSIADIAESLDVAPQTVKNQLTLAIKRLRKELTHYHYTPEQILLILWLIEN